jgi:hypothetical protein
MHPCNDFANILRRAKREHDVDAPDHQNALVILDFSPGIGGQTSVARIDLARFQRATKGA